MHQQSAEEFNIVLNSELYIKLDVSLIYVEITESNLKSSLVLNLHTKMYLRYKKQFWAKLKKGEMIF